MITNIILSVLLSALSSVESGYDTQAYNRRENAIGILQIRPIVVKDVNRLGYYFTYDDRYDFYKSMEMAYIYLSHYSKRIPSEHYSLKNVARIWNGGPEGWKKRGYHREEILNEYAEKVKREYIRLLRSNS